MIVMCAMVFLQMKGKPLCNFQEVARSGISWDAIMLTATVLPITSALANDEATGFITFITDLIGPIIEGKPAILFILLFMIIAVAFTNFCTNAGTASSLSPIALAGAGLVGANPALLIIFVIKCCHMAYFTPVASPATALAIGRSVIIGLQKSQLYQRFTGRQQEVLSYSLSANLQRT